MYVCTLYIESMCVYSVCVYSQFKISYLRIFPLPEIYLELQNQNSGGFAVICRHAQSCETFELPYMHVPS